MIKISKMDATNKYSPLIYGMRMGVKISILLTSVYWMLGVSLEFARQIWLTQDLRGFSPPITRYPGMVFSFFLFHLVIMILLGTSSGMLIGEIWNQIGNRVDSRRFAILILLLCGSGVIAIHRVYHIRVDLWIPNLVFEKGAWFSDTTGLLLSYPFLIGVPSIIFPIVSALGGFIFHKKMQPYKLIPSVG